VDRSAPAGAADGAAEVFARLIDLADDRRWHSDLAGRASPPLEARMRGSSCFTSFTSTTELTYHSGLLTVPHVDTIAG